MPSEEFRSSLQEMGFENELVDKCLELNQGKDYEAHIQWIISFKEQQEKPQEPAIETSTAPAPINIKCDICGKLFLTLDDANLHAYKTEHESFSESTEEFKPMTEEEKKAKLAQLQEKLKKRSQEQAEQEAKQAVIDAKTQRESARKFQEAAKANEEREILLAAEQRKQEKLEEIQAKKRVLQQIENDRLEREARMFPKTSASISNPTPNPVPKVVQSSSCSSSKSANIKLRFKDAHTACKTFSSNDNLQKVFDWIREDHSSNFRLFNSFPRVELTSQQKNSTLKELDLVPSACLLVE